MELRIRPATEADLAAITAIYAREVLHGTGTFELAPPDETEMGARLTKVRALGAPWLVATDAAGVQGYAYAGAFRDRPAFRFTVEDSVYVAEAARGRGAGRLLLDALLVAAEAAGFRQMLALIGDAANVGSIRLHEACGFQHAGVLEATGWKHNRWLDVVVMRRALGQGGGDAAKAVGRIG